MSYVFNNADGPQVGCRLENEEEFWSKLDEAVEYSQSGRSRGWSSAKGHMCWMEMAMNTYFRRGGTLSNIRLDAHR